MDIFQEAERDVRRALELGDVEAAEKVARELYRHLLTVSPGEISDQLGEFIEKRQLHLCFNAVMALAHSEMGLTATDMDDRPISLLGMEEIAVNLSPEARAN